MPRYLLPLPMILAAGLAHAQTSGPSIGNTPVLPAPYSTKSVTNTPDTTPFHEGASVRAADGLAVNVFAEGLDSPRNAVVLPNGDVLVAEATTERKSNDPNYRAVGRNRILLLRDTNGDGRADVRETLIGGLSQPYGMQLIGGKLYIANANGVFWTPYTPGTMRIADHARRNWITRFDPTGYNNHWTRNLLASRDGRTLFIAVGSASNAGEFGMEREARRAAILAIDLASGRERVFADGIRNPVGMALEPRTGRLWTSVNERDELGDDLVPDYIVGVKEGGFYGWPYSYWGKNPDPRLKGQRPDLVAKAITPDFAVGAHASALGIAFGAGTSLPARFRDGAFVARHGSWNRSTLLGYDVVFVPFRDGKAVGPMQPVLTGFTDGPDHVHGRPRALATANDGSLLVVDDKGGRIWRIAAAPPREPIAIHP
ncbi:PQQ-dependent sugar dehydrogenase [Sphingomonas sp. CFBP 13720]|uniref:PQQ-dependent sugar dehydrogenase n=1 Tax=Sphingomonas sp. CFBP 13720 TaxID=2775302 RepID=UPI0017876268|nr:sorbosone dehydrogenase family protein [Sphingomonas sp. CFBP 13720]MBD8678888.1 sorbosone dehydrogenase family protein [Sphingomonas sp. CFBP 13720]